MIDKSPADEPEPTPETMHGKPGVPRRLWLWLDRRTEADALFRASLDEPVPGGARFAYVFGSALLFLFVSQVITGVCLAVYYVPSPLTAHVTLSYIIKEVAGGAFLRSLHSYGSSAMIVVLFLHFLQTFLYGSYKGKRDLLWIAGCVLALLLLGMTFTGYLLRWDLKAYFAGAVGTSLAGDVPLIGGWLLRLLRGGETLGALTLSRFYVLHVFVLPAAIFSFIALHIFLFRKAGAAGPVNEDPVHPHLPAETFYPKQVIIDMLFVFVVMGILGMLAHFVPVELGPAADPSNSNYLPRPEWYYLPFFEWLKYWDGAKTVIGVVVIPGILIALVFLLPFMDRSVERRPWRRPIAVGSVLIVLLGLMWLGMQSRLNDSTDSATASQLAQQNLAEDQYFHAPFRPYSSSSPSGGASPVAAGGAAAHGKALFDSSRCSGCHGQGGVGGGVGPALTHISATIQPAQLTALLKAPNAKMKAGGMVPLTLNAADMAALVSYVSSLGGPRANSAPAPGSPPSTPAAANAGAPSAPAVTTSANPASSSSTGSPKATTAGGKPIYQSQGCAACHGDAGNGTQRGPALVGIGKKLSAAQISALLHKPNAKMKAGGMPAVTGSAGEIASLVAYLRSLPLTGTAPAQSANGKSVAPTPTQGAPVPSTTPATTSSPSANPALSPSTGSPKATTAGTKPIYQSQGCAACHGDGGKGTQRGPALAGIGKRLSAVQISALLHKPNAKMKAGGMPAVKGSDGEIASLVAYLRGLSSTGTAPAQSTNAKSVAPPPAQGAPAPPITTATGSSGPQTQPQTGAANVSAAGQPPKPSDQRGASLFNGHGCAACHGPGGTGTSKAPALATFSKTITPAALTSLLQHPNHKMQAGGMPPANMSAADISALVAYLQNVGTSATAPASNSGATVAALRPMNQLESKGKVIFGAYGCAKCHGMNGAGGTAAAPALAGTGKNISTELLTKMLQQPTTPMHRGGMPPVSVGGEELKELVAYVSYISSTKAAVKVRPR